MKRAAIVLAILAMALSFASFALAAEPCAPVAIDGDTIGVCKERIRIANIDTPETFTLEVCKTPEETLAVRRLGYAAQGRLQRLLNDGAAIKRTGAKDRYGRSLATVSLAGRDVGVQLVSESLARTWAGRREPWCPKE